MGTLKIITDWKEHLEPVFSGSVGVGLKTFLEAEKTKQNIFYPKAQNMLRAFNTTALKDTKVVILGQDPYHGEGQANGLAFAVNAGMQHPPSLQNIFKELSSDMGEGLEPPKSDLEHWATQGVLLLNSVLTVRKNEAASHAGKGWEEITDHVIACINGEKEHVVFILWGRYAAEKGKKIDAEKHCIIQSPHPSPLSAHRGFFGSKPFSKTNAYLEKTGQRPIDWAGKRK